MCIVILSATHGGFEYTCCIDSDGGFLLRSLFICIAIILFEVMYLIHAYDGVEY